MRLSFRQCCHAFVAFSQAYFRVKPAPERFRLMPEIASLNEMLQEYGKRPQQGDTLNEAS
jgi:hypothetical protein